MKGSSKTAITVTVCGLFAAISVVLMLVSYIGTLSYALAAAAGALLILIYLELGTKNAFTVYFAVSVLSFMLCNKEAALCYTLFFGYYPILKAFIEKFLGYQEAFWGLPDAERPEITIVIKTSKAGNKYVNFELVDA